MLLQKGSLLQRIMGLSIPHVEGSNGYPNGAAGATRSVADGTATKVTILNSYSAIQCINLFIQVYSL